MLVQFPGRCPQSTQFILGSLSSLGRLKAGHGEIREKFIRGRRRLLDDPAWRAGDVTKGLSQYFPQADRRPLGQGRGNNRPAPFVHPVRAQRVRHRAYPAAVTVNLSERNMRKTLNLAIGVLLVASPAIAAGISVNPPSTTAFAITNLVSNQSGKAKNTDPNLVDAWGLSQAPAARSGFPTTAPA